MPIGTRVIIPMLNNWFLEDNKEKATGYIVATVIEHRCGSQSYSKVGFRDGEKSTKTNTFVIFPPDTKIHSGAFIYRTTQCRLAYNRRTL